MKRRGRELALVGVACALGASCQPIPPPPAPSVPVNVCPQYPCSAFTQPASLDLAPASCSGGQCLSSTEIDFSLVVSLPESSFINPGVTIAIPQFVSLFTPTYLQSPAPGDCQLPACVELPAVVWALGSLTYANAVSVCAGRSGDVSIPSSAQLFARWKTPTTAPVYATTVGLPLLPIASLPPPGGSNAQWLAVAGPTSVPVLDYEEDVFPVDDAYPPLRLYGSPQNPSTVTSPDQGECPPAPAIGNTTFTVSSDGASLSGFKVYLRDAATLTRVSSRTTLGDVESASVTLVTAGALPLEGKQLVIEPPDGLPIPTLADTVPPVAQLQNEKFPSLPQVVTVAGTIRDATLPYGRPIAADLVIDSLPMGIVDTDNNAPNTQQFLSYSTTAHAGPDGNYSVVLPPGTYDAFIVPASGVAAGAVSGSIGVQAPSQKGGSATAEGKDLVAAALGAIRGTAVLADGRILAGAEVEAHVAASVAGALDPRRWPRTATTVTDAKGMFSLAVDPGTYDVVVRPAEGSAFPWVTITSQPVGAGGTQEIYAVVPAPIWRDLVLHDGADNPISFAVVRAFAPSVTALITPGVPQPQIELGTWLTDASGHFTMYLAPPE